jgi:PIN domain nuclease of toxin-antitoxin system
VKLLLDTCAFLWLVDQTDRVPPHVLALFESPENDVYLSTVSAWEIAITFGQGRLALAERPERFVPKQRAAHHIASLAVDEESALHASRLPHLHRDPFDRLLVSQAIVHGMTILTPDPILSQYPARTFW